MNQRIAHVALLVRDYDEAIDFYTQKLNFQVLEDTRIDEKKRWVMIAPSGGQECCLLLAKASTAEQTTRIGNQTGGRVGFFLFTDNLWDDVEEMKEEGINFLREPAEFEYGIAAVFEDLYGNKWDLIEPTDKNKALRI